MPKTLQALHHHLTTQDNRGTSFPIFILQRKKRVYGFDPNYADEDQIVFIDDESCELTGAELRKAMDHWEKHEEELPNVTRTSYQDVWEFVTCCFTEQGIKDYLELNGHNVRGETRIYVESATRNEEWQFIRSFLMGEKDPNRQPYHINYSWSNSLRESGEGSASLDLVRPPSSWDDIQEIQRIIEENWLKKNGMKVTVIVRTWKRYGEP